MYRYTIHLLNDAPFIWCFYSMSRTFETNARRCSVQVTNTSIIIPGLSSSRRSFKTSKQHSIIPAVISVVFTPPFVDTIAFFRMRLIIFQSFYWWALKSASSLQNLNPLLLLVAKPWFFKVQILFSLYLSINSSRKLLFKKKNSVASFQNEMKNAL